MSISEGFGAKTDAGTSLNIQSFHGLTMGTEGVTGVHFTGMPEATTSIDNGMDGIGFGTPGGMG